MPQELAPPAPTDLTCSQCGYDLRALPVSGRCPECGTAITRSARYWRELAALVDPRGLRAVAVLWLAAQALFAGEILCDFWANAWTRPSPLLWFVLANRAPVLWPGAWWVGDLMGHNGGWRAAAGWLGIAAAVAWADACWYLTAHGRVAGRFAAALAFTVRWLAIGALLLGMAVTWYWSHDAMWHWPAFDRAFRRLAVQYDPLNPLLGLLIALHLRQVVRATGDHVLRVFANLAIAAAGAALIGTVLVLTSWPFPLTPTLRWLAWYANEISIACPTAAFVAVMIRLWRIAGRAERAQRLGLPVDDAGRTTRLPAATPPKAGSPPSPPPAPDRSA